MEGRLESKGDLWVGDSVRLRDGSYALVEATETVYDPQVMYNVTVAEAHTYFVGDDGCTVHNASGGGKHCGFPFDNLRGKSLNWLKRNKPKTWKQVPTRDHEGWVWLDEAGIERLRYMRPKKSGDNITWSRQEVGYLRWQDKDGNYLDIDGNVIHRSSTMLIDEYQWQTHIPYEGIP